MNREQIQNQNQFLFNNYNTINERKLLENNVEIQVELPVLMKAMRMAGIKEEHIRKPKYQDFFKCFLGNAKRNLSDIQWMSFSKNNNYYDNVNFPDFFTRTVVINSMEAMLEAKTFIIGDDFKIGLKKKQAQQIGSLFLFKSSVYEFVQNIKVQKPKHKPSDVLCDFYDKNGDYVGNVRGWQDDSSGRFRHELSNLKRTIRKDLDWDGKSTSEVDLSACYITMLYDFHNIPRPFTTDAYEISNGLSRDTNKFLVNNLIFCGITPKYFASIRNQINKKIITDIPDSSNTTIQKYLNSVLEVHGALIEHFNKDNRFLFRLEGKITSKVFDGFVTANKKIFTNFDGCIVQTENKEFAKSLLANYWKEVLECEHEPIIKDKDVSSDASIVSSKSEQPALLPTILSSENSDDASRADQFVDLMLKAETDELNKEETRKKDLIALKAIKNRLVKTPGDPVKPIKEEEPLEIPTVLEPAIEDLLLPVSKDEITSQLDDGFKDLDWS